MLGQLDSQNRERVIAYGGRALRPAEQKWDISDRESLALIEVIKAYHVYLANKTVTVYTDSMAVRWLKETPVTTLTGRRARWRYSCKCMTLQERIKEYKCSCFKHAAI